MSKRFFLCLASVGTIAFVRAMAAGLGATPQLLVNGDFEKGNGDRAAAWGVWPPAGKHEGVSSLRDAAVHHRGQYSGRLQIATSTFAGICTWHHRAVPVRPGQEVVLRFWIKGKDIAGHAACDVQLRRGPQNIVGSRATRTWKGTFSWTRVTHRFVIPEGVDHICVVPLLRGRGTVWFDEVEAFGVPETAASRVTAAPVIDGRLEEDCWAEAQALDGFSLAAGSGLPQRSTRAWIAYDAEHLYVAFYCAKKPGDVLRATVREPDGDVWKDDDVELFVNPRGNWGDYYQFVVNPAGTKYESHRTDRSWNLAWKAAVRETPAAWTVELAIPAAKLPLDLGVGPDWCVNFCRADKVGNEVSAWSCPFGGFHTAGRFGRVTGIALDYGKFYARDARDRLERIRRDGEGILAGNTPAAVPAAIAGPWRQQFAAWRKQLAALEKDLARPERLDPKQWQALRARLDAAAAALPALRAASTRMRLFSAWKQEGEAAPGFGLTAVSSLRKVFRDGRGGEGKIVKSIELQAAGNEYEAAQVLVVSLTDRAMSGFRAATGALEGPGGARIGGENLKLGLVGYVETARPKYPVDYVGEWPDPLLPNAPFTLAPGETRSIWLRVYVPPSAPPGDYAGSLTVTGGKTTLRLPVRLHVFGFRLPRRQHLATPFGCDPGRLCYWYTGSLDYRKHMPPEVFTRWNRFLLDYRLTPTSAGRAYIEKKYDAEGRVSFDFSRHDACMAAIADRLPRHGMAMASVGHFGWHAENGARMTLVRSSEGHGMAGRAQWPKTAGWASLVRSMDGRRLAAHGCTGFRFRIKGLDPAAAGERITAFVNAFPKRWVTTFPIGGTEWHEVRLPLANYHNNQTGAVLTRADLEIMSTFQFVIARKDRALAFLVDDIVGECPDGPRVIDDFDSKSERRELRERIGPKLRHWQEKGWFEYGHVYGWDEARPEEYDTVVRAYRAIREIEPKARIMQTYDVNRSPVELADTVRIWCPLTANYDAGFLEARRAAGNEIWLYVCCGPTPPHANFFIDQPALTHRLLFWQAWQHHCTGFLYWQTDYWFGMMTGEPGARVWPEEQTWKCANLTTYRAFKVNGDGWLLYPGKNWTPLPSIRLEAIRDGIEDFEYLWLLRERDPDNPLLRIGPEISRDWTAYCRDADVILRRRLAIARAIENCR